MLLKYLLMVKKKQPLFKRADLGRYLDIARIKDMFKDVKNISRQNLLIRGAVLNSPSQRQNDHDAFVDLDGALEIVVRSRKPKAIELVKWLTRKGVEKVVEEKDTQLALLNDDFIESQERVRQLEFNNTGMQGEIRAKDQELVVLRQRHVDHCRDPRKDNIVIITRKHTDEQDDKHFEYPYYISRIQRRAISTKRRWLLDQFPHSEEIVVIDNPNSIHAFNRFEEEGHVERYKCHFRLVDLTREDLYDMGVPAIHE